MNINFPLLKKISETPGAPGFEQPIRSLVLKEIESLVDKVEVDVMGNIIAFKKGRNSDKKVMVAAHMDEIGFIVQYIDPEGFIRFYPLGGFDPKTLTSQRVIVHGKKDLIGVMGCKPIHMMKPEERKRVPGIDSFFIDLGMSKKEVEKYVKVGDAITRERTLIEMGHCVSGKSLDNRISVFILIEALKRIDSIPYDLYATFTVQEEVGIRGAQVAAQQIDPDFGIALDVTIAYDQPGAQPQEKNTFLGKGTCIKILDARTICDTRMVGYLEKIAKEKKIKWQYDIKNLGGTDTAALQRMGKRGSIAGAVAIPTRYIHQVVETAHKEDISASIDLLVAALESFDNNSWER